MNLIELQRALRQLRLGGTAAVLETRLRQAQAEAMAPIDLISCLVSDELTRPGDRRLVIAESAIDALSYATLFPDAEDHTRYASLGGRPSSRQMGLVQATIARLPGTEIVTAFDADDAGRKLAEVIREAVASVASKTGRSDLIFKTRLPADEGEDWNQVLQNAELDHTGLAKQPAGRVKQVRPE